MNGTETLTAEATGETVGEAKWAALRELERRHPGLDKTAVQQGWLARFPMFDWIGGRTSVLSAVGLLPAALQGLDIDGLLRGAASCDEVRGPDNLIPGRQPAQLSRLLTD